MTSARSLSPPLSFAFFRFTLNSLDYSLFWAIKMQQSRQNNNIKYKIYLMATSHHFESRAVSRVNSDANEMCEKEDQLSVQNESRANRSV